MEISWNFVSPKKWEPWRHLSEQNEIDNVLVLFIEDCFPVSTKDRQ